MAKDLSLSVLVRDIGSIDSDPDLRDSNELLPQTNWEAFKLYIYNPRRGTCCDRTSRQWMTMLLYYLGYTAFIVCLYLGFLYGCVGFVKFLYPDHSIIDKEVLLETAHPGLGFVPNIVITKHPIIWYSADPFEDKADDDYVNALDKFLRKYKNANKDDYVDCTSGKQEGKLCYFDLASLGDCNTERYQYSNSSLCFFLKLNRRKHWKPTFYKSEQDLPDEMSQSMMDHIVSSSNKHVIYVECLGQNLWDNEHMGQLTYYPKQGFDGYYFPYKGENDYLPPLVAVKMTDVTTGIVIHIKCTVWAQNIGSRLNHLQLKIFIDNTLVYF